ncbi:MAG: glycosyltransferase family 1 protein [Thermoanaerobaculia bacterium]
MPYAIGIDARKLFDFGIGTYIKHLIEALAAIDAENRYFLLTTGEGRDALSHLPENFKPVVERSQVYSLSELLRVSQKLRRLGVDLYHSTHYVLPAFLPCPAVATIHDIIHLLYPDFLPNRLALLYAQRMMRSTLSRAERILTVSRNTKSDLMEFFEVDPTKIEVVYNGVDDRFRGRLDPAEIDQRLARLGVSRPYLLFVGNPKPHKNLNTVIQAYAHALSVAPFEEPLVCVGAREGAEFKLRQRAEHLGIGDRLKLVGYVDDADLPALYQGATLFLYPTLYEGFGLPVAEAMASGTAVVTSNTSALREIAEGYAYLVDPHDVARMGEAIAVCVSDPERRAGLAELGLRRAGEFRWQKAAEETLAVYRRALEGRKASRP